MSTRLAYVDIAEQLRGQILTGQLKQGDQLPTEAELCDDFQVSRSTVREALRMLSAERFVTTSRGVGGGTHVVPIEHDDVTAMLRDQIILLSRSEGCTLEELMEVRRLLEGKAVRLAARQRTPEQVELLRGTIPATGEELSRLDLRARMLSFHAVVLQLAGNRLLRIVTEPIFQVMQTENLKGDVPADFWPRCNADHAGIFEAVVAGDEEQAARLMNAHLDELLATYQQLTARVALAV